MTTSRNTADELVSRIETLVHAIGDRDQILAANRAQLDTLEQKLKTSIEDKLSDLENRFQNSLSAEIQTTSEYTKSLYTRFERWFGAVYFC